MSGRHSLGALSGGARSLTAPALSGLPRIGDSPSIAPGTWRGGPTLRYQIVRGGVPDATWIDKTLAQINAYTYTAADIGPAFRVREYPIGQIGRAVLSNAVQFTSASLASVGAQYAIFGRDGLTLVSSTHVSEQADLSGNARQALTQPTDANRPLAIGSVNGMPATWYDAYQTTLGSVGGAGPTIAEMFGGDDFTIVAAVFLNTVTASCSSATYYEGAPLVVSSSATVDLCFYRDFADSNKLKAALGAHASTIVSAAAEVTEYQPHVIVARKSGTTLGIAVDGGTEVTNTLGASSLYSTSEQMATGFFSVADQILGGILGAVVTWSGAASSGARDTVVAFLAWLTASTQIASISGQKKIMFCGDSIVHGQSETQGGWRTSCLSELRRLGYAVTPVGPYDSYGLHRGVDGEKAATVAAALGTFATELTTAVPDVVVLAWGTNDLDDGSNTSAQLFTSMDSIITQVRTSRPSASIVVVRPVAPGPGAAGGRGTHGAEFTAYNGAAPAHYAALGVSYADIGSPTLGVDDIHPTGPINVAGGYQPMGLTIAASIAAILGTP